MTRRGGFAVLLLGLVLVAGAAMAGPRSAPPLYDGLCIADPYVYLTPPGGKPSAVTKVEDLTQPVAAQITTGESPPQAQVIFPAGALQGTVTFAIHAVAPPETAPPNGPVDGNVYSISATDAHGAIAVVNQPMSIVLRSPGAASNRTIDAFIDGRWAPLTTSNVGCAFQWLANTKRFGEFAIVNPAGGGAPAPEANGSGWTVARTLGLIVGIVAVLVATILLVRAGRTRSD